MNTTERKVTVMPATLDRFTAMPINGAKKRRVAAYARVSTDEEEQLNSYEAQVNYYTQYIGSREDWEFAGIYSDVDRSYGQNPKTALVGTDYGGWYGKKLFCLERHRQASQRLVELEAQKRERLGKGKTLEGFIQGIEYRPLAITEFDEKLWLAVIDQVKVGRDGSMTFRFKNGAVVDVRTL